MVEPETAISVSVRFGHLFYICRHCMIIMCARIEHKHVARPFESNLPISTVYVCLSVRLSVRK